MKRDKPRLGILLMIFYGFALAAVAAPQTANHSVTVGWTPAAQPDGLTIESYNIYRSTGTDAAYTPIATVSSSNFTYLDTSVSSGTEYFYVVTSVDTSGIESAFSAPTDAIIPAGAPLSVATTALPASMMGATYDFTLTAAGGSPPYTWIGDGIPGLIVSSTGLLAGNFTQSGTFVLSLAVTDSAGATAAALLPIVVTLSAPPAPSPIFPSGLLLYWPLDSSHITGGVAADLSGNSNTGTILGSPVSVPGQGVQALGFGNSGAYITGTQYTGGLSTSLSLAAWINTANTSQYQTIFSKFTYDITSAGYIFAVSQAGNLNLLIGAADLLSPYSIANDTTLVADGNWHHVAATISFESQTVQFYVDGRLRSSTTMNIAANGDGGAIFQAGATSLGLSPNSFTGSMDDVQVYGRALTADEVNAVFGLTGGVTQ